MCLKFSVVFTHNFQQCPGNFLRAVSGQQLLVKSMQDCNYSVFLTSCYKGNQFMHANSSQRSTGLYKQKHIYTLWTEKTLQNVFCHLLYKTQPILVYIVLSKFVIQKCKRFTPHLNSVCTLPCETKHSHFASEQQFRLRTKNAPKCFCHILYKTRPILVKLGTYFPN